MIIPNVKLRINFNIKNTLTLFYLAKVRLEVRKYILTTSFVLLAPGKPSPLIMFSSGLSYMLHSCIYCILFLLLDMNKVMELKWNQSKFQILNLTKSFFIYVILNFILNFLFCTLYYQFFSFQSKLDKNHDNIYAG